MTKSLTNNKENVARLGMLGLRSRGHVDSIFSEKAAFKDSVRSKRWHSPTAHGAEDHCEVGIWLPADGAHLGRLKRRQLAWQACDATRRS